MSQITTTNNSNTTIQSVAVPLNSVMGITCRYTGRNTGASGGTSGASADFVRTFTFKNLAGVVSQVGSVNLDYTNNPLSTGTPFVTVNGTNLDFYVNGKTGETWKWQFKITSKTLI